jgi:hypothetical protein
MSAKTSIVLKLSNGWITLDHVTYVETTTKKVHLVGGEVIELLEDDFWVVEHGLNMISI